MDRWVCTHQVITLFPSWIYIIIITAGPTLKLSKENMTLKKFDNLTLYATVDGIPKPTVQWKFNGADFSVGEKISQENKKDKYSLNVKNIDENYAGVYSATATNDVGESSAYCEVVVEFAPLFTQPLEFKKCLEGTPFESIVQAIGFPEPNIEWFKDGKPLVVSENVNLKDKTRLCINEFQISNAGTYKAVATNSIGSATTDAKVDVLGNIHINLSLMNHSITF